MESYGLTATAVTAVSDTGTPITLSLADVPEQSANSSADTAAADIRAHALCTCLIDLESLMNFIMNWLRCTYNASVQYSVYASTYMYVLTHRDILM